MLSTTRKLYDAFLDGIKKSYTGTVKPDVFNRLINDWGQDEWLRHNVAQDEGIDLTQKQQDDLERIRCVTDGLYQYNGVTIYPISQYASGFFTYPKYSQTLAGINLAVTPWAVANQVYPKYYRLLNVAFYVLYGADNVCGKAGTYEWIGPKIMRTDQRIAFTKSPYRKPSDERPYYELIDGKIRLITNSLAFPIAMRLEYLRMPVQIFYNTNGGNVDQVGPTYDYTGVTPGSVNCEFDYEQKKEIVEMAVRIFLERVKDDRYKSFFNEEMLRSNTKK